MRVLKRGKEGSGRGNEDEASEEAEAASRDDAEGTEIQVSKRMVELEQ